MLSPETKPYATIYPLTHYMSRSKATNLSPNSEIHGRSAFHIQKSCPNIAIYRVFLSQQLEKTNFDFLLSHMRQLDDKLLSDMESSGV